MRWKAISKPEDLPDEGQLVLAFGKEIHMCEFNTAFFYRYTEWTSGDRISSFYWDDITHWMPLPPKPGDESPSSDPAEVLELRQWKKEAMELLNPIMEYGRTHPDIKLGSSVTEFVLNRAKAAEVLAKALEKVLNPDYTQSQKQWAAEDALSQYEQLKQQ